MSNAGLTLAEQATTSWRQTLGHAPGWRSRHDQVIRIQRPISRSYLEEMIRGSVRTGPPCVLAARPVLQQIITHANLDTFEVTPAQCNQSKYSL